MYKKIPKLLSLKKEATAVLDIVLLCRENNTIPTKEQDHKIFTLLAKIEKITGSKLDVDKYPKFKADYAEWNKRYKIK